MKKILVGMAVASCFLVACSSKSVTMTGGADSAAIKLEKIKTIALDAEKSMVKKDVDGMFVNVAPKFVDYGNGEEKPMTNADTIKAGIKEFLAAFPDYKGEDLKAVAEGDTVIITGTWSGTFKAPMMGIKPNGKSFKYTDADIFIFTKDGKMMSHRSTQSNNTFFSQLGITPPKMQ